jgi:hypothetical protein
VQVHLNIKLLCCIFSLLYCTLLLLAALVIRASTPKAFCDSFQDTDVWATAVSDDVSEDGSGDGAQPLPDADSIGLRKIRAKGLDVIQLNSVLLPSYS